MFVKLVTVVFFIFVSLHSQVLKSSSQSVDNFTYNGFHSPLNANITLQGIGNVTPSGLLKLTNSSTTHETGHAFYNQPIRGHGIAFVVAPNFVLPVANSSSEHLGLFHSNMARNETVDIFAVELNTVQSADHKDMNDNTIGIDINGLYSVKSSPAGYWNETGQFKDLTLNSDVRMQVWVDYDGSTHRINVTMAPFNHYKPTKPLVSTVRDLSSILLQDMFVGFSSSTGSVWSEHFVLGWSFQMKGKAPPLDLQRLPKLPQRQNRIRSLVRRPYVCMVKSINKKHNIQYYLVFQSCLTRGIRSHLFLRPRVLFSIHNLVKLPCRIATESGGGGGAHVFASDTLLAYGLLSPVVYRSIFGCVDWSLFSSCFDLPITPSCKVSHVYLSSFFSTYFATVEWIRQLFVWVTLELRFMTLVGDIPMVLVLFGPTLATSNSVFIALARSSAVCSSLTGSIPGVGVMFVYLFSWWQFSFLILPPIWSELEEQASLVLQGSSSHRMLFSAYGAVGVVLRVTLDAI
ncbi:unnamed protein product, partial [Brassica oleracea]